MMNKKESLLKILYIITLTIPIPNKPKICKKKFLK
jgi:hypothetical protein